MRKTLTDKGVQALKPRPKRYAYPDPELRGHYIRIQPSGSKAFVVVARSPAGKQIWSNIGAADVLGIDVARARARAAIARVRAGLSAFDVPEETFETVARRWLERHVQGNKLRSERQIGQLLELHAFPFWKGRPFLSIKRSDVTSLLDDVEDDHGARQADQILAVVSSIMSWFATRHDDYQPPVIRGMRRRSQKQHARKRVFTDDELCEVWRAAEDGGTFGGFVRIALLTAQRKAKVATMKWSDISLDGEWKIPHEPREKDSAGSLMLPVVAVDIIKAQPRLGDNPYVFAGRFDGPINGFTRMKQAFDARLSGVEPWVIHDLRRTARSLMSRAGVLSDHAERVMGHAIGGIEGIYDRHQYATEKADALRRLAGLIDGIVHPRENVTPMRRAKRR